MAGLNTDVACPYCGAEFEKPPQRQRWCKSCGQRVHCKYGPGEPRKRLLTDAEACDNEKAWHAWHNERQVERDRDTARTPYGRATLAARDGLDFLPHLKEHFTSELQTMFTLGAACGVRIVCNRLAARAARPTPEANIGTPGVEPSLELVVVVDLQRFAEQMRHSNGMHEAEHGLRLPDRAQQLEEDTRTAIDCCDVCALDDGRELSRQEALDLRLLPHRGCTCTLYADSRNRGFCRCGYEPVFEDER